MSQIHLITNRKNRKTPAVNERHYSADTFGELWLGSTWCVLHFGRQCASGTM